jgi:hypothetical protein
LILILGVFKSAEHQDQKIAAFGSSYRGLRPAFDGATLSKT